MGRAKMNFASRAKNKFSRIVQVSLSGSLLKSFDAERIHEEDGESATARDLIREALKVREVNRKK